MTEPEYHLEATDSVDRLMHQSATDAQHLSYPVIVMITFPTLSELAESVS